MDVFNTAGNIQRTDTVGILATEEADVKFARHSATREPCSKTRAGAPLQSALVARENSPLMTVGSLFRSFHM